MAITFDVVLHFAVEVYEYGNMRPENPKALPGLTKTTRMPNSFSDGT